jgi:hypothetical protein
MLLPLSNVVDLMASDRGGVAVVANRETSKRELWCWGENAPPGCCCLTDM